MFLRAPCDCCPQVYLPQLERRPPPNGGEAEVHEGLDRRPQTEAVRLDARQAERGKIQGGWEGKRRGGWEGKDEGVGKGKDEGGGWER